MTVQPSDVYEVLHDVRKQLGVMQAKVSDALTMLAELNLPDQPTARCGRCGIELRGALKLAEHLYQMHDGPLPDHWARIDLRALEPDVPLLEPEGEIAWEEPVAASPGDAA